VAINITKRFFSRVTRYFDRAYEGRYFSVILAELARIEPMAFLEIIKAAELEIGEQHTEALLAGGLDIDLEWPFPDRQRRADLALCLANQQPVLLAEIKVEDDLREGQLSDYLSFVNQQKRKSRITYFLLLTRYPPIKNADSDAIEKAIKAKMPVGQLRAGQLRQILDGHGGTVARMVCEYLEDVGMTYQTINLKQDRSALIHMCYRMIGIYGARQGRIRSQSSIELIPVLMTRLLGNVEVLATWLYTASREKFGNRFCRDFSIERESNKGDRPTEGSVWFYASGRFNCPKNKWAYLTIGYAVWMEPKPSYGMFAEFEWGGGSNVDWDDRAACETFKKFPNESDAQQMLHRVLTQAKTKAVQEAPSPYRQIFRHFKEP
jgi:hypothetical protein